MQTGNNNKRCLRMRQLLGVRRHALLRARDPRGLAPMREVVGKRSEGDGMRRRNASTQVTQLRTRDCLAGGQETVDHERRHFRSYKCCILRHLWFSSIAHVVLPNLLYNITECTIYCRFSLSIENNSVMIMMKKSFYFFADSRKNNIFTFDNNIEIAETELAHHKLPFTIPSCVCVCVCVCVMERKNNLTTIYFAWWKLTVWWHRND